VFRLALALAKLKKVIIGALFLGVEPLEQVADHTPPYRAKVNNNGSYTPTPPYDFMVFTKTLPLLCLYQ
jgi:hypothetical protein